MIARLCSVLMGVFCFIGAANSQEITLEFSNLKSSFRPPAGYIRVDNTDSTLAVAIKAGTPETNHLLAVYAKPPGSPYFVIQTSRGAATSNKNYPVPDLIALLEKNHESLIPKDGDDMINVIRERVNAALKAEQAGTKMGATTLSAIGVFEKTNNRISILMRGRLEFEVANKRKVSETISSYNVFEVNGFPMYLYVYTEDDKSLKAIADLITLTNTCIEGFKQPSR